MRHERKLTWGRRVPASAFVSQGSMPWLTNTWISILQVLPIWGIEPQVGNADAGTRRPQVKTRRPPIRQINYSLMARLLMFQCFIFVRKRLIYKHFITWNIRVVCFIFAFNVSSYKHWRLKTKLGARDFKPQCKRYKMKGWNLTWSM